MIDFKLLNRSGLEDFIESPEFKQLPAIPISRQRALSQIKNPRAESSDVLLILAYSSTEIVGYLGTLPDTVFISGREYKCAVLSCIWVKPEFRKSDVSMNLLRKVHDLYDLIFGSDYVPAIFKMYERSGFFSREFKSDGVRVYMRMDLHSILPPKREYFKRIKPVLYFFDQVLNGLLDIRFPVIQNRMKPGKIEYIKDVDSETANFIRQLQERQLFKRNREELNWILNNPWILTNPSDDDSRYYFDSIDKSFDYICIKLRNSQDELVAFVILSKRNRVLRIPYCYMKPDVLEMVGRVIVYHIYKWKINTFITHHPELSPYFLRHKFGRIFKKKAHRLYFFSKELHQLVSNVDFEIQDGDADSVFI